MIKFVFLLLVTYVTCESTIDSVTTVQPIYSANQVDDDSSVDLLIVEPKGSKVVRPAQNVDDIFLNSEPRLENIQPTEAKKVSQVNVDLKEIVDNAPEPSEDEVTTIIPSVTRVKRTPRYTVRELMAPFGVLHEVAHLRDHVVNRVANRVGATRLARISKARTEIHHKYHHIPNHMAYLPVVGPLFDENRPRLFSGRSRVPLRVRLARYRRMRGLRRRSLLRRIGLRLRNLI